MRELSISEKNLITLIRDTLGQRGVELSVTAEPQSNREYDVLLEGERRRKGLKRGDTVRYMGRTGVVHGVGPSAVELEMPDGMTVASKSQVIKDDRAVAVELKAWLPTLALRELVNWQDARIASMTDFEDSVMRGEWAGVARSSPAKQWAIFDRFVRPLVEGP